MTSKLIVNTIEADTGISSVSFASSISMDSTSKFHFSAAGIDIGADTNINRPAAGVIGFNVNGAEKLRIDTNGHLNTSGIATASNFKTGSSNLHSTGLTVGNNFIHTTGINVGTGATIHVPSSNVLTLGTANGERLRITSAGNLQAAGITTSNTGFMFGTGGQHYLYQSASDTATLRITSDGPYVEFKDVSGDVQMGSASGTLRLSAGGNEKVRIDSSGQMGLGTISPSGMFEVQKNGVPAIIANYNNSKHIQMGAGSNGAGFHLTDGNFFTINHQPYADRGTDNNLTERLRIDSNGYITEPSNPKFWAKSSNAQTLNSNSSNIIKNYENEIYDIGNCYDGTNKFTAPINGYYHFGWSFMLQGGNADTFTYLFGAPLISGNDIQQEVMSPRSGGAQYVSVVGSHLLYLTSGQYVQIRMRQSGGSNVSVRADQSYFWGYLVG